jgi:hypothetical protein
MTLRSTAGVSKIAKYQVREVHLYMSHFTGFQVSLDLKTCSSTPQQTIQLAAFQIAKHQCSKIPLQGHALAMNVIQVTSCMGRRVSQYVQAQLFCIQIGLILVKLQSQLEDSDSQIRHAQLLRSL